MNEFYEGVHQRREERYLRREARRKWEADRPKRIVEDVVTVLGYALFGLLLFAFAFVGSIWAAI